MKLHSNMKQLRKKHDLVHHNSANFFNSQWWSSIVKNHLNGKIAPCLTMERTIGIGNNGKNHLNGKIASCCLLVPPFTDCVAGTHLLK